MKERENHQDRDKNNLENFIDKNSYHKSFTVLVKEYHRSLLAYAVCLCSNRESAMDLCQETFITAFKKFNRFDVEKNFGAWVRGILKNKWRNSLRSKNNNFVILEENVLDAIEFEHSKWDEAKQKSGLSIFSFLKECIDKLPNTMKEAVDYYYFQGMNGKEASDELQIKEPTFRKTLQRSRSNLRSCIESKQENLV